jgi:hypothetical protein
MGVHEVVPKPSAIRDLDRLRRCDAAAAVDGIEEFLLERNPRFRRMLDSVKREKSGMTLSAYRKSRSI